MKRNLAFASIVVLSASLFFTSCQNEPASSSAVTMQNSSVTSAEPEQSSSSEVSNVSAQSSQLETPSVPNTVSSKKPKPVSSKPPVNSSKPTPKPEPKPESKPEPKPELTQTAFELYQQAGKKAEEKNNLKVQMDAKVKTETTDGSQQFNGTVASVVIQGVSKDNKQHMVLEITVSMLNVKVTTTMYTDGTSWAVKEPEQEWRQLSEEEAKQMMESFAASIPDQSQDFVSDILGKEFTQDLILKQTAEKTADGGYALHFDIDPLGVIDPSDPISTPPKSLKIDMTLTKGGEFKNISIVTVSDEPGMQVTTTQAFTFTAMDPAAFVPPYIFAE